MVFRLHSPGIKVAAVQMLIQNQSFDSIRISLGKQISRQSFNQWLFLYQETCCVICNPKEYTTQGQPDLLTQEDKDFMTELIDTNPGLFLEKIRDQVYNNAGTKVSIETIHYCLTRKLGTTLKKAKVYNVQKNLVHKYECIGEMRLIPAKFPVFTDESAVCSKDLLCPQAQSKKLQRALKFLNNLNPKKYSLIPAISVCGLLAITVLDDSVGWEDFEHFLKWRLVCLKAPFCYHIALGCTDKSLMPSVFSFLE
jgi:hypothetical protein